uniref:Papain family cysteine protease containing protein n=1 Tax=Acanthamoeba castellanii TaxID=5755 RepID=A0A5H2X2Q3_ACACA|nr:papain family cysteine protease containing protein [Acanthamoeba castellanii]
MRVSIFLCAGLALLALLASGAGAKTTWDALDHYSFDRYVVEFNKAYASDDEVASRRAIFESRLAAIKAHNRDASKSWKQGVNQLTDRSEAEIRQLLGYNKGVAAGLAPRGGLQWESAWTGLNEIAQKMRVAAINHVDWREKGVISPVKDQGQCGSCWTFGSSETLESYWALATGQLPILSEQHILDCIPNPDQCGGTGGCAGGTAELVYRALMTQSSGLASEWTYPYRSYWGEAFQCSFNTTRTPVVAKVKNYVVLPSNKYDPVIEALTTTGPLVINVDVSSWHAYESGVFDGCNQTNPDINHVVQLVGYGTDAKEGDYWLVRNSWSPVWGEKGYIRLKRRSNPICGIDLKPSDGTGCKGGPATVTVCGECGLLYDVSYPVVATA